VTIPSCCGGGARRTKHLAARMEAHGKLWMFRYMARYRYNAWLETVRGPIAFISPPRDSGSKLPGNATEFRTSHVMCSWVFTCTRRHSCVRSSDSNGRSQLPAPTSGRAIVLRRADQPLLHSASTLAVWRLPPGHGVHARHL
jgi:hypothetical protein